jgi:formate hydrogenlyase transcriptional activator
VPYTDSQAGDDAALRELMLAMAGERSLDDLLGLITGHLAALPSVALARIWLVDDGDICERCPMARECPDRSRCLHLVASAGQPSHKADNWSRLDGQFRRFPLGVRKIGRIATTNVHITVPDVREELTWIANPAWVASEGIIGFTAKPLAVRGEVVGVLGVFTRTPFDLPMCQLTGVLANHAAISIANARAFAEVERLQRAAAAENELLRAELSSHGSFGDIIGTSPGIRAVTARIGLVAPTPAAVLITGESGTGKELVAREIHRGSDRAKGPLVRVNCAAIPGELFESEFFGHVKGSFTGATNDRQGRFAAADDGTLFLDEIGEIPLALQGKLLRVLQEGTFERVGEERTRHVDVRIIAATNRDLSADVSAGRFRADLYYRLNVVPIHVPPLRERRDDIAAITHHLLANLALRFNRPVPQLSRADLQRLEAHNWPGNIRELSNVLERALITGRDGRLAFDLPPAPSSDMSAKKSSKAPERDVMTERDFIALEKANLQAALAQAEGKIFGAGGAADLLGIKPTTLLSRLKRHGIKR